MKQKNNILKENHGNIIADAHQLFEFCKRTTPFLLKKINFNADDDEVKDLISSACEKILKVFHQFNPSKGSDATWLSRVIENLFRDYKRNKMKKPTLSLDNQISIDDESYSTYANLMSDDCLPPDEAYCNKQYLKLIMKMREKMNPLYHDVVICIEYYGLNGKETAQKLGITHKAVATCLRRGKERLKQLLIKHRFAA